MKPIGALGKAPDGLADYLDDVGSEASDWTEFRSYQGSGAAYRDLLSALAIRQHGLCGYCENALRPGDQQIEHIKPQSKFPSLAIDYENMIACCQGGSPSSSAKEIREDEARFLPPTRRNLSCGTAKGDAWDDELLDPRMLPPVPSLIVAHEDGRLEPDPSACAQVGTDPSSVEHTIDVLGLNVRRLRRARERRWRSLRQLWRDRFEDPGLVLKGAKTELLPSASSELPPYFTTSRCFFGTLTDGIDDLLAARPQSWI